MPRSSISKNVLFIFVPVLLCCKGENQIEGPERPKAPVAVRSALLDAPALVTQAQAGVFRRGEQDLMMRFEAIMPGFGGLYLDDQGVKVYMKGSQADPAALRSALAKFYAVHPNPLVREVMADAANAVILPAQFSLSELVAVENRVVTSSGQLPGLNGVGTSLRRNIVDVAFSDSASLLGSLAKMNSLGIPTNAIHAKVMAPMVLGVNFENSIRPTRGGIKIGIDNASIAPNLEGWCSLGYNVRIDSVDYVMTASHCANLITSQPVRNGPIGDTISQDTRASGRIAVVDINPAWDTVCPNNPETKQPYEFCTNADVMLGRTSVGERKIATSVYGGVNGALGREPINGYYQINGVYLPEYVKNTLHKDAAKSGSRTYTTSGPISDPIWNAGFKQCWGYHDPGTPCPANQIHWLWWTNQTLVGPIANGGGDSGGPVFTGYNAGSGGAPYAALGLYTGGNVNNVGGLGICSGSQDCFMIFTRWDQIEKKLGMGTINPATVQP